MTESWPAVAPAIAGLEERIASVVQAMNLLVGIVERLNTESYMDTRAAANRGEKREAAFSDLNRDIESLRDILEKWLTKWEATK